MDIRKDFVATCILGLLFAMTGCKPAGHDNVPSAAPAPAPEASRSGAYFATPFQTESEYVVGAIATDLAEEISYAATHHFPEKDSVTATATEAGGSVDVPEFKVTVMLNQKRLETNLVVDGPIWAPEVYASLAAAMAKEVGLKSNPSASGNGSPNLLADILDSTAASVEKENQSISAALETNFASPELHEQAALLLGAFVLRDHSGHFYAELPALSRITAHLTIAGLLREGAPTGLDGQLARAILLSVIGNDVASLQALESIKINDPEAMRVADVIRTTATADFRPLGKKDIRTRMENVAWFSKFGDYTSIVAAWDKLDDEDKKIIDYVRVANELSYSVEIGHALSEQSISLELAEEGTVYKLFFGKDLETKDLTNALNVLPGRCFMTAPDGSTQVRVIGWGQWADFLQRHLCHAVQQGFHFMNYNWGVPDEAKSYAEQNENMFNGLRLYPFVRRFNCTDVAGYHAAVDDGFKVTVATPELVPAECWNYLCYNVRFAPPYRPNPNPHINEWHNHNPLPGTVYDLNPRLDHPSLIQRADALAVFETLHQRSPRDLRLICFIMKKKFDDKPTYEQALPYYSNVMAFSVAAMRDVANISYADPVRYEKFMLDAAHWAPGYYFTLGDYFIDHGQEDKGAEYYDKAAEKDTDAVDVANHSLWRVRYYLNKGDKKKASDIADFGAEVYSEVGLEAKAAYMEGTSNYDGAFEWYGKIEERYSNSWPLINFCQSYRLRNADTRFQNEVEKRVNTIFPQGLEKVSIDSFRAPPTDGVVIISESPSLRAVQMKKGDIVVALNGTRIRNIAQNIYVVEHMTDPNEELIVWQGDGYRSVRANLPNHRFGVNIDNYVARRRGN